MDAPTFLDNFAAIAEAPDGVQRIRLVVLELALLGRLVDQDPSDESADQLLAQIAIARSALIDDGRLRKQKERATVGRASRRGWAATDLGAVVDLEYGKSLPAPTRNRGGSVPVFGSNGLVDVHDEALVDSECVVVGRKGSAGAINIARGPSWPIDTTYFVQPLAGMTVDFIALLLRASRLNELDRATAVPGLNREDAYRLPVLLPPLAEQGRIVAKVAELMGLCDDLEERQRRRHRAITRFRSSALHALTAAATSDELRRSWDRVSTHWPEIADHIDASSALRSTVLQLAIEGRLVGRVPSEGTAADAIRDLRDERFDMAGSGLIGRPKPWRPVDLSDVPFQLPSHWSWIRVEDAVTHVVDCLHRTPAYRDTGYPAIRTCDVEPGRVLIDQALLVDQATFAEQTRRLVPEPGDVLYSREGGRYGIAAVVPQDVQLCLSQRMMQFRCGRAVAPDYFSWFLNSPFGFGQAMEDVGGSASPHVNIRSIRRFLMPLPPTEEQRRIVHALGTIFDQINALGAAIDRRQLIGSQIGAAIASHGLSVPDSPSE